MNKSYTIDELISGYYEKVFSEVAEVPLPRFSLKHKLRMNRIFKLYAKNKEQIIRNVYSANYNADLMATTVISNVPIIPAYAIGSILDGYSSELEFQIFSNDDTNFPINMNIDVDPNSIEYEKLVEPVYDFEYALIEEMLDFDVIASLKPEFNYCDEYDVKIMSSNYEEVLFSQTASNDCSITIPALEIGETYSFCINVKNESASNEYTGEFAIIRGF